MVATLTTVSICNIPGSDCRYNHYFQHFSGITKLQLVTEKQTKVMYLKYEDSTVSSYLTTCKLTCVSSRNLYRTEILFLIRLHSASGTQLGLLKQNKKVPLEIKLRFFNIGENLCNRVDMRSCTNFSPTFGRNTRTKLQLQQIHGRCLQTTYDVRHKNRP